MSNRMLSEKILQRDGTGQAQRYKATLAPASFPVEERTLEDWIQFAQQYAGELQFFDENNQPAGTWRAFLDGIDVATLRRYIESPETFTGDEATLQHLSRPHVVLFISFLQLLTHIKEQINGFTKQHLDFYYYNVLGLTPKGPVPDEANIIIELADEVKEWWLPKGTTLFAGQDAEDKDLVYVTEKDSIISQAVVKKIKTFFSGKKLTTLLQVNGSTYQERLLNMFQLALGDPNPGDPLPYFRNQPVDLDTLIKISKEAFGNLEIAQYLVNHLYLNYDELTFILDNHHTTTAGWKQVAYYLQVAYSKKIRSYKPLTATAHSETATKALPEETLVLQEPQLITWDKALAVDDAQAAASSPGDEQQLASYLPTFGKPAVHNRSHTRPASIGFALSSPLLLLQEGFRSITLTILFKTTNFSAPETLPFPFSLYLSSSNGWWLLPASQYRFSFQQVIESEIRYLQLLVQIDLADTDPAIVAPAVARLPMNIQSKDPVLGLVLNQNIMDGAAGENYGWIKDLLVKKINLLVKVSRLTVLSLQNDDAIINYKKPFEPFGYSPEAGSHFYFSHPEFSSKPLQQLTLHFKWMNAPADFKVYYQDYSSLLLSDLTNLSFTADLKCIDDGFVRLIKPGLHLFNEKDLNGDATTPHVESTDVIGLSYLPFSSAEEVINQERYFVLQLQSPDFGHQAYPHLLTRQAFNNLGKNAMPLPPPYTPKLTSFMVDYESAAELDTGTWTNASETTLFHIHTFGYTKLHDASASSGIQVTEPVNFLPHYQYAGELYIGMSHINAPQNLSLFFQLAEGSADPELEKPEIFWSVLGNNTWLPLQGTSFIADSTNGLRNTGIVELAIPAGVTCHNTLLNESLYWLRASVLNNTEAIPDTVSIHAQGIKVVFRDDNNAPDHYRNLMPPGSIKRTVTEMPEINSISQPYSSTKGKPAEEDKQFYKRVSERLRHKNRALTMWDYEHLVLEQFPGIYKVKCVPGGEPGSVELIVIPDIKGKLPFNPFEPKASSQMIADIRQYLSQRAPAWAIIMVKNPTYIQVKLRIAVKIKEGYSENFFLAKLENDLTRYLAPWAYDEGAEIYLDTRLDADVIINFVAEQPYIAYASDIHLFTKKTGDIGFVEKSPDANGEYYVQATQPGEILVSAPRHEIDVIREYKADNYRGIGYMKIELDFRIG